MPASRQSTPTGRFVVRPSRVHDRGVFAAQDLRRGSVIDSGHVLVLPTEEPRTGDHLERYVFAFDRTRTGVLLGVVSLCNHDPFPNVEVEIDTSRRTYRLLALRTVQQDEELLLDYGSDYWQSHDSVSGV